MTTLLLVDDNDLVRTSIRRWLSNHGYYVREAGSVAVAMRVIENFPIDVIVTDFLLTDGTGSDLCNLGVPAICVSGSSEAEGDFVVIIPKPIDFDELVAAIEKAKHADE